VAVLRWVEIVLILAAPGPCPAVKPVGGTKRRPMMFTCSSRRTVCSRTESPQCGHRLARTEVSMSLRGVRSGLEDAWLLLRRRWAGASTQMAPSPARVALTIALGVAAVTALTFTPATAASNIRFYIASQYSWEQKVGFYLDLEGAALSELPVILGVGDGTGWRYPQYAPRDVQVDPYPSGVGFPLAAEYANGPRARPSARRRYADSLGV